MKSGNTIDPHTHRANCTYHVRQPDEEAETPKVAYPILPVKVKNVVVDMIENRYESDMFSYSDNTGDYIVKREHGEVSLESPRRFYFSEIGLYQEFNAQGIFVIYGIDYYSVFKTK